MRTVPRVVAVVLLLVSVVVAPRARGQEITIIEDPRFEPGAQFGHALATLGSDVFVGAPASRVFDVDGAGIVQRFDVTGNLRVTFEALTPVAGAALGTMVVTSGDRLYASAPGDAHAPGHGAGIRASKSSQIRGSLRQSYARQAPGRCAYTVQAPPVSMQTQRPVEGSRGSA